MSIHHEIDQDLAVESNWKPWSPTIGQRVRIRLSEECTALRAAPGEKEKLTRYHSRSETGRIGKVVRETPGVWNPRHGLAGHAVLIDFSPESVHFQGCISFCALYFAAEELEPAADQHHASGVDEVAETPASSDVLTTGAEAAATVRKPNRSRRERRDARRRARLPDRPSHTPSSSHRD